MSFLFSPPPPGIYEYTQVLSFHFPDPSVPSSLSDEDTDVGKVWASTLRTYLELEQTGMVWWALVHGTPQKAKLFIDWKTAEGREHFEASQESEHLGDAWKTVTSSTVHSAIYRLPYNDVARQTGLISTSDTVSVLFTFTFTKRLSDEAQVDWNASFSPFSQAVMKSPGGVVASFFSHGWDVTHKSYCAAFRYLNTEAMRSFLEGEGSRLFEELRSRARVEIEFLETRVFKHGWQGSVEKTRPDEERTAAFITDAQRIFGGINSTLVRGE
ncbi:hypothetical protein ACJZ2D_010173 [Fusarium nematophilum]